MDKVNKAIDRAEKELSFKIEQKMRMIIKPSPKWIPKKLWLKMAGRFIVFEFTPITFVEGEKE